MEKLRTRKVEIRLNEAEISYLDNLAAQFNINRAELMRRRAFANVAPTIPQGATVYAQCVQAAAQHAPGVPRVQLEAITAAIITKLSEFEV